VARGLGDPRSGAGAVMALAEGRFRLSRYFYALAQYSRTWSLDAETRYYDVLQVFNVAVGSTWSS